MKTKIINLLLLLLIGVLPSVKSQTLDQSSLNFQSTYSAASLPGYSILQSFTCGITGTLVEIDLGLTPDFNAIVGSGTLKIYSGLDTTGILLQTTPVSVNCPIGDYFTNFTTSVPVTSGQVYTFRFIPGAGIPDPYDVQLGFGYLGGKFLIITPSGVLDPQSDVVFRTFVTAATGISTMETNYFSMKIYPNPLTSFATLQFNNIMKDAELNIYNLYGQKIKSINNIYSDKIEIDRNNLPNGLYFVQLTQDNTTIAQEKLVITD
jgi:hypothetical protein